MYCNRFGCVLRYSKLLINSFMGNQEIKTSNKTKEEIVEGLSLRVTTSSRAYIRASPESGNRFGRFRSTIKISQ